MSYIGKSPEFGQLEIQVLTPDTSTTVFDMDYAVATPQSVLVVYGGVVQEPGVAYSINGQQIVFDFIPVSGIDLYILYFGRSLDFGTPSDGTVSSDSFAVVPFYESGRLTLESGVPVSISDQTAKTTLYFTPYKGNRISIYNGTKWKIYSFSELSLDITGFTANKVYDVFIYNNNGVLTLDSTVWTNDTTRATALTTQDGVYVKTGETNKKYLGTFRTTGVTGQTEDSKLKMYVWNYYNRVLKFMSVIESTNSWSYTTAAFRQANSSSANQLDFIIGVSEDVVKAEVLALAKNDTTNVGRTVGVGVNSTSVNSAQQFIANKSVDAQEASPLHAKYIGYPSVGRTYLAWLEYSEATGSTLWYGDAGTAYIQSGMRGELLA